MTTAPAPGGSDSPTSDRATLTATWAAVVVTILLALGPGIVAVASGGHALPYDGAIAVGAANAVIVAIYTYFTRQALDVPRRIAAAQAHREAQLREQERASLATALLAELSRLWGRLAAVKDGAGAESPPGFLVHALLDKAVDRLHLYRPETIEAITALNVLVSDVEVGLGHYRELQRAADAARAEQAQIQSVGRPTGHVVRFARLTEIAMTAERLDGEARDMRKALGIRAVWALRGIERVVPLLEREGGRMPAPPPETETSLSAPLDAPPDPFPRLGSELRPRSGRSELDGRRAEDGMSDHSRGSTLP